MLDLTNRELSILTLALAMVPKWAGNPDYDSLLAKTFADYTAATTPKKGQEPATETSSVTAQELARLHAEANDRAERAEYHITVPRMDVSPWEDDS